jgi:hypothetical protein
MRRSVSTGLALALLALVVAAGLGCGDSKGNQSSGKAESAEQQEASEETAGEVPSSLGKVESGAEDTIDLAHNGDRAEVVRTTRALRRTAEGAVTTDLRKAGVAPEQISLLRQRARLLETLAPRADLARVSLAANQISALMPGFYARYEDPVPPDVLKLDYLDREAQLRSLAGDRASVRAAVDELSTTWTKLRPKVIDAGGDRVAGSFSRHVRSMRRLAGGGDDRRLQKEAVTGLELVDELESQFRGQ